MHNTFIHSCCFETQLTRDRKRFDEWIDTQKTSVKEQNQKKKVVG